MKRLSCTNNHLSLENFDISFHFVVYMLKGYDFSENLDFEETSGLYIFSKRDLFTHLSKNYKKEVYGHQLYYCGRTSDYSKRFNKHFKAEDLKKSGVNCICIYSCQENEIIENEKKVLGKINFPFNIIDNQSDNKSIIKVEEV